MATRRPAANKEGERVAVLETKFDMLKETVEIGFRELGEKIDAASLNGQTPRVKNMSATLGDPETVAALAAIVESRKRWGWALKPFQAAGAQMRSAFLWGGGALALVWVHGLARAAWPRYVP